MSYDVTSLDFIYYPVSAVLWFWHKVFGFALGPDNGWAWLFSVFFLVFTLRALYIGAIVKQRRTTMKMSELNPQLQGIRRRYAGDRVKMTEEMQKLQKEHGFNPLLGCLPAMLQIPVFIGLFHVIRSFNRTGGGPTSPGLDFGENASTPNYVFGVPEVQSFLSARVFDVPLSTAITTPTDKLAAFADFGGVPSHTRIVTVCALFMLTAAWLTHHNARFVIRSKPPTVNPQERLMNQLSLYVFPLGVLITGAFFPLAILGYWLGNNVFTNLQTRYLHKHVTSPDGAWPDYAADARVSTSPTDPALRANHHVRIADKHGSDHNHRLKYFHLMAAGHLAGEAFGASSTPALNNYLRAADCARYRSQKNRYDQAMAHVTSELQGVSQRRITDQERRELALYYEWIRVFATREMSTKGAAARLASEQLPYLRKQFAVQSPVSQSAVANNCHAYKLLGMIAAAAITTPGGTEAARNKSITFAAQTGAALIACGARADGRAVLRLAAATVAEASRTRTLAAVIKAQALDYLSTQVHDAAMDTLEPVIVDAIDAGLNGIGAGVDAVQSLF